MTRREFDRPRRHGGPANRRVPLEHVLGWVEFCGLRIAVDPGVFVPRRRTELLVRQAAVLGWPRACVVDLLVANAPYIPTEATGLLPPEARVHEPRVALDGRADGLEVQRKVVAAAPSWLAAGGHLLVETSERQAPHTVEIFTRNGLMPRVACLDELDATVVIGTKTRPQDSVRMM